MRKILVMSLAVLLLFSTALMLAGCINGNDQPVAPKGYTWYENQDIRFAYPDSWTMKEENSMVQLVPASGGNNIVVTKSQYDATFDNISVKTVEDLFKPQLELQGLSMSNIAVAHDTSKGTDVAVVTYDLSYQGMKMEQTIYMFRIDDFVYSITITEAVEDLALVQTVLNTLTIKNLQK